MQAPEGTLISYATQPGNVALDGESKNSPYTKALAQTLRKPGLGIFEAFNEVGLTVMQATGNAQQPWLSSSPIKGNFQFASSPATQPSAPLPAARSGTSASSQAPQVNGTRTFEPRTDREGINIKDLNLNSPDARQCQSLCVDEQRCTAWVYRAPEGRTDGHPHCWLRSNAVRIPADSLTIAGDVPR
jgi:hypothetical protein